MKYPNYKDMAVEIIEELCLVAKPSEQLLETIYMCAHVARNRCQNPHKDWREIIKNIWSELKCESQ